MIQMQSKLKPALYLYHLFLGVLISGLLGAFYIDFYSKMPKYLSWVVIGMGLTYPVFVLFSLLSIPKIVITEDEVKAINNSKVVVIKFQDIHTVERKHFINKIYRIGYFFSIRTKADTILSIPYKVYANEEQLLSLLEKRLSSYDY